MKLGEKIKAARLEAGMSQRQLCGEKITRNMLSLIECGTARPSMDTLAFLAERLGKPVSYFLEETVVTSPNQELMKQAREALRKKQWHGVMDALERCQEPDPMFDQERWLLEAIGALCLGEEASRQGRDIYAEDLLRRAESAIEKTVYGSVLSRRRLLLSARLRPRVAEELPGLDEELCLLGGCALNAGDLPRAAALLDAAVDRTGPDWNWLRGEVYFAQCAYQEAARCYHRAELRYPEKVYPRLEVCYRELADYKMAYVYACKDRQFSWPKQVLPQPLTQSHFLDKGPAGPK